MSRKPLTPGLQPFLVRLMQQDLERTAQDFVKASGFSGAAPALVIKRLNAFARTPADPVPSAATPALPPEPIRV